MKSFIRHSLTFLAGFLTRPCCVLPAALALLGVSGAGVAAALAPYRAWFLWLAVAMFAASFYWNFIRNRNRAGMVVWGLSVLVAIGLWMLPTVWPRGAKDNNGAGEAMMSKQSNSVSVSVKGMACNACARRLERVLGQVPGVFHASVNFEAKKAQVSYDPGKTNINVIEQRIDKAGFEVEPNASAQAAVEEQ